MTCVFSFGTVSNNKAKKNMHGCTLVPLELSVQQFLKNYQYNTYMVNKINP
jgi:hypothetical protein